MPDGDSDVEGDCTDDQSKMLTDTSGVKLRHCGFCGIEVSSITKQHSLILEAHAWVSVLLSVITVYFFCQLKKLWVICQYK